jgi:hypothetical protein
MLAILYTFGMFVADLFKSRSRLEAENVFLRHQLTLALRQKPPRARLRGSDRALLVWMVRLWPSLRNAVHVVQPETILRWHRAGVRAFCHAHPALLAHAPHDVHPDEDDGWDDPGEECAEKGVLDLALEFDSVFGKRFGEAGINANSREMRLLVLCRLLECAGDGVAADRKVLDGT